MRWAEVRAAHRPAAGLCHIVARDITERDEADAERLGQAFRDSPTGIAFVGVDGSFRRVNAALARLLGATEERSCRPLRPGSSPRTASAAAALGRRGWEDGAPRSFELEARLRRADGRAVVALVSGTLVDDLSGEPLYYVCQFQDVTERIEAQYALADERGEARRGPAGRADSEAGPGRSTRTA